MNKLNCPSHISADHPSSHPLGVRGGDGRPAQATGLHGGWGEGTCHIALMQNADCSRPRAPGAHPVRRLHVGVTNEGQAARGHWGGSGEAGKGGAGKTRLPARSLQRILACSRGAPSVPLRMVLRPSGRAFTLDCCSSWLMRVSRLKEQGRLGGLQ